MQMITIVEGLNRRTIEGDSSHTILELLQNNDIYINAVCGGVGRCGKCEIQVIKGTVEISEIEKAFYSKEELEQGYRLACVAHAQGDIEITLGTLREDGFQVVGMAEELNKERISEFSSLQIGRAHV